MLVHTNAIVLHTLKYNDSSLIVHCYTQAIGKQSFLLKGILTARKGKFRTAYFQPLMLLEVVFNHKKKSGLQFLKEVKVIHPYQELYSNIKKNAIALFLSEMVYKSLGEEEENALLFAFLKHAFLWLDAHEDIANFHLIFLLKFSQFLGFYPNVENIDFPYFNLASGCFTAHPPQQNVLEGEHLEIFKSLLGMNFDVQKVPKINQHKRRELIEAMVSYFELHLLEFSTPKSLAVLHAVFD